MVPASLPAPSFHRMYIMLAQIYPLPNVLCTRVGQGCLFGYLARSEFPCPPDRHDSA